MISIRNALLVLGLTTAVAVGTAAAPAGASLADSATLRWASRRRASAAGGAGRRFHTAVTARRSIRSPRSLISHRSSPASP